MKIQRQFVQCVAGVMAITCLTAPVHAAVTLPASAALPTNSVSNPGFVVRTAQASITNEVANSYLRAARQINGLLTDTNDVAIPNIAIPGTEAGGVSFSDYVSFEKDSVRWTPSAAMEFRWALLSRLLFFPGIPNPTAEAGDNTTRVPH